MPRIFRSKTLTLEYVSQMRSTFCTFDFDSLSIRIRQPFHGTRYFIIKARPAAVGIEFVFRLVQRCVASLADVSSRSCVCLVLTTERAFRALSNDYSFFFWRQFIVRQMKINTSYCEEPVELPFPSTSAPSHKRLPALPAMWCNEGSDL
jgi:hypothetical protein